jgi:hypothetical protein
LPPAKEIKQKQQVPSASRVGAVCKAKFYGIEDLADHCRGESRKPENKAKDVATGTRLPARAVGILQDSSVTPHCLLH